MMDFYNKLDAILSEKEDAQDNFVLISEAAAAKKQHLPSIIQFLEDNPKSFKYLSSVKQMIDQIDDGSMEVDNEMLSNLLKILKVYSERPVKGKSERSDARKKLISQSLVKMKNYAQANLEGAERAAFSDLAEKHLRQAQEKTDEPEGVATSDDALDKLIANLGKTVKPGAEKASTMPKLAEPEPETAEDPTPGEDTEETESNESEGGTEGGSFQDFLKSGKDLGLKDAPEEPEGEGEGEGEEAPDPRLAQPKKPDRHEYEAGAKNIAIVKQSGDTALVRVRGLTADRKRAIYRYMTVDADALEKATGDPDLDETNIWRYIKGAYDKDPKAFRRKGVADADSAFSRFEKLQSRKPAKNVDELVKRVVGENHKDMLINAYRNYARGNRPPGSFGGKSVSSDLLPVLSTLSSDQVAQLMELYPGVRKTRVTPEHIKRYLGALKRRLSPLESKQFASDLDKIILEAEQEFHQHLLSEAGWRDWLQKGMSRLRGEPQTDTEKYIRQAYLYDRLIERMVGDLPRLAQNLQRVGVDVSKYPELKELAPMHPDDALTQAKNAENSTKGKVPEGRSKVKEIARRGRAQATKSKVQDRWKRGWSPAKGRPGEEPEEEPETGEPEGLQHQPKKYQAMTATGELKDAPPEEAGLGDWGDDSEAGNEQLPEKPKVKIPAAQQKVKGRRTKFADVPSEVEPKPEAPKEEKPGFMSRLTKLFGRGKKTAPKGSKPDTRYMSPEDFEKAKTQAQVEKIRQIRREYAEAISNNILIEEARLLANDHAYAALQVYTERCNSLNRTMLESMHDDALQLKFDRAFNTAKLYYKKYSELLEEAGIESGPEIKGPLLESIIQLIQLTSDLLCEENQYYLSRCHTYLTEMYHQEHIGVKNHEGGFVPPSKIF